MQDDETTTEVPEYYDSDMLDGDYMDHSKVRKLIAREEWVATLDGFDELLRVHRKWRRSLRHTETIAQKKQIGKNSAEKNRAIENFCTHHDLTEREVTDALYHSRMND